MKYIVAIATADVAAANLVDLADDEDPPMSLDLEGTRSSERGKWGISILQRDSRPYIWWRNFVGGEQIRPDHFSAFRPSSRHLQLMALQARCFPDFRRYEVTSLEMADPPGPCPLLL
jgi:hypothetical protein